MPTDASIALSLKDNVSAALIDMSSGMSTVRADVSKLQDELTQLSNKKVSLKMDVTQARQEANLARKAYEELGDSVDEATRAAAKADWTQAETKLESLRQQYDSVSRQVRQTTKDIESATTSVSKLDNRASSSMAAGSGDSLLSALATAGITSLAGDVGAQFLGTIVSSAVGSEAGSLLDGALSGAAVGAGLGTVLGGPVGTAMGAGIGAVVGTVGSASQVYQARDDAFKDFYGGVYDTQSAAVTSQAESGSATASQRELDAISFSTLITDKMGAPAFLREVASMAAKTPFEYSDLTAMTKNLSIGFGDDAERILDLMMAIGNAGATIGASASDMQWMATALSRMQSTDLAQLGEINMFQDRGINVIGMLADYYGTSEGSVRSMISKGDVGGREAVNVIQEGLSMYDGAMETMSATFDGLTSTLSDTMAEIYNASGESYNASRSESMAMDIDAYGGSLGDAMKEAYSAIGAGQAALENLQDAYTRDALSAVLEGGELTQEWDASTAKQLEQLSEAYQAAMEDYKSGNDEAGVNMDSIITTAQGLADEQFKASDLYQQDLEAQENSLTALRENTAALQAASAAYSLSQSRTPGMATVPIGSGSGGTDKSYASKVGSLTQQANPGAFSSYAAARSYAYGLDRVPYDNFPSLLHEGERVLTAREARAQDQQTPTISISVTGNTFTGATPEEVGEQVVTMLLSKLKAGVY